MRTFYIAAEKFICWDESGQLSVNRSLIGDLGALGGDVRTVVYFAPERFGFLYEDMCEVQEAWDYLRACLEPAGFRADDVVLFANDVQVERFQEWQENAEVYVLSGDSRDEAIARTLHGRRLSGIPSEWSGFWRRLGLGRGLRALFAAISEP